jgi:hypothetical protein
MTCGPTVEMIMSFSITSFYPTSIQHPTLDRYGCSQKIKIGYHLSRVV